VPDVSKRKPDALGGRIIARQVPSGLDDTGVHTLARQMGTSVVMLEQHYSKLSATLAAGRLA
jgi:hypothetical protein